MSKKNVIKDTFITRSRIVLIGLFVLSIAIVYKIIRFQTTDREELLALVRDMQMKERLIPAKRGNIFASDGQSILATSTSVYKAIIDPTVARQEVFDGSIDELAKELSLFFKDKSAAAYKEKIIRARKAKLQYVPLSNKRLNYKEKQIIEQFPLFSLGALKGGGYFEESEIRFHPYYSLAKRTIGNVNNRIGAFGIEAEFDEYLRGLDGKGFYERLPGGYMKPVTLDSDIDAKPGLDIVTTLDVNFQDIAESALRNRVNETEAQFGSVVVMEIETGEIKAIANLTRRVGKNGEVKFSDDINYAVTLGTDPGSTFKLASILAILEKSGMKPTDFAVDCKGGIKHNNVTFTCSHAHGDLTVQQVFEKSCNIGVYTLMKKVFGFGRSDKYYNYLVDFRLDRPTGFQLRGEPKPTIKNSQSKTFSSTTIPWMSIGYETKITPMQMLAFYNAVANNGYWVQPLLVKEIRNGNTVEKTFTANKIGSSIASKKSIESVKMMMKGVVENGTAKNINYGECKVAGKTGTAQKRVNGDYTRGLYYTSFIGYFPADKPKYSCVVVIDSPKGQNVYGGDVCAPVFKTIADKIYAYDMNMHKTSLVKSNINKSATQLGVAKSTDQAVIARTLGISEKPQVEGWAKPRVVGKDSVVWENKNVEKDLHSLVGLTLRDALPILENKRYKVHYTGKGRVAEVFLVGPNKVSLVLQ